jgi:thiol:disulfide interchange protein DsbA
MMIRALMMALVFLLPLGSLQAIELNEGENYELVTPAQPGGDNGKPQIVELFWYGCPHCFHFEPYLTKWLDKKPDDIEFVRVPAIFNNPKWSLHATAFYTAEILGIGDKIHGAMFHAMHEQHRALNTPEQLKSFFAEFGVSAEEFDKTFNSFAVKAKVSRAADLTRKYGITGVPSIVVEGKYRVDGKLAGSYANMLKVAEGLARQEQSAQVAAQ